MKIEAVGYTEQYKNEVLHCLKRNYKNMENMTDEALYDWAKPFLTYELEIPLPDKCKEFQHGAVLLDDGKVIGYLGLIFGVRKYKGKSYICQSGTTWAIDDGYRLFMFPVAKKLYQLADILGDFTPNPPSVAALTKLYKYKLIDNKLYKFYPIPYLGGNLNFQSIKSHIDIENPECAIAFKDLHGFGVKCVAVTSPDIKNPLYVFYRCTPRKLKRLFTVNWVTILSASDWEIFGANIHAIVWHLQKQEMGFVECEGRFVNEKDLKGCKYVTRKHIRLGKGMPDDEFKLDLLYTELAMLDYSKV